MGEPIIQFGIIGCAEIARKVSRAIILAPNAHLSAVASRTVEKAAAFAKANNFPSDAKIYGSYESLLDDPDIDVVYVPLPTSLHVKWACLAAKKKKHVLLEKPVGLNVGEFDKILEVCETNGVQIMDGTMWMHNPRTQKMKEFLADKERFGEIRTIHSCFTFAGDEDFLKNDIRVKPDLDGLGALGDAGWYGIRAILWATDYELPNTVIALHGPILNEAGVILACSASFHWDDGKIATFHCSFLTHLTMYITAIGTNGTLHLDDFIIPFNEKESSFTATSKSWFNELVTGWTHLPNQHTVAAEIPQEACMVREFARLVANIKVNGAKPDQSWPIRSRKTQILLDAVKASIERGFEPVKIVN
ncbi:Glyceraldehyde-3-phosphate dehydrogenase-like family protein [Euphorbia peplus]|nr:Glyceraldehyde-3-phosphate dehydrogenase-like family protein [Euphorbia peplus]